MGGLDPRIALAGVPVNINVGAYQTPYQIQGGALNLQQLMQQNQMGALQLQQAQIDFEEAQRLSQMLYGGQANQTAGQVPAGGVPGVVAQPAGGVLPAQRIPLAGGAPQVPLTGGFMPLQAAPAAVPVQPVPQGGAAGIPSLLGASVMSQPGVQPAPDVGAAGSQETPAAPTPTGQIQYPGQFPVPDFSKWAQVAPMTWGRYADKYMTTVKNYYDVQDAQFKQQQNVGKRVAQLADSIQDEPTKMTAIGNALSEGFIGTDEASRLVATPWDAPIWKSWKSMGMTASENATNEIANARLHMEQVQKAFELAEAPYKLQGTIAQTGKTQIDAATAQRNLDASTLAAAYAQGPQQGAAALATLPPERQGPFIGVQTPQDVYQRALTPSEGITAAETRRQHAIQNIIDAQKEARDQQTFDAKYGPGTVDSYVEQVYRNPDAAQRVPPEMVNLVTQGLQQKHGIPFPEQLDGGQRAQETASRATLTAVNTIRRDIDDPEVAANIGAIMGKLQNVNDKWGTAMGLSASAAQKAQELRTQMRLLIDTEPKEFGGRLSPGLMEEFQKNGVRPDVNVDRLKGALDGTESYSKNMLDTLDKSRFGGQMRPRTDRGLEPTQQQADSIRAQKKPSGTFRLSDGTSWYLSRDGKIVPVQ